MPSEVTDEEKLQRVRVRIRAAKEEIADLEAYLKRGILNSWEEWPLVKRMKHVDKFVFRAERREAALVLGIAVRARRDQPRIPKELKLVRVDSQLRTTTPTAAENEVVQFNLQIELNGL